MLKPGVVSKAKCPRCIAYGNVVSGKTNAICRLAGIGHYDATRAEALVRSVRRKPKTITASEMRRFVSANGVFEPHCLHVNTRKFCIIGTYIEPATEVEAHFMLDGNHRGYIRACLGRSTRAYVLTLEETQSVFIGKRAPKGKRWVHA